MPETGKEAVLVAIGTSNLEAAVCEYARIAAVPGVSPEGARSGLFAERVGEYGATVETLAAQELVGWVANECRLDRVLVGPRSQFAGESWAVVDDGLPTAAVDEIGAALVEAAAGAADTGTLILDGRADGARRALSLIPDRLICVVRVEAIFPSLEEWWPLSTPDRPITLISGPSATSDIELNRVVGVHGPRRLQVVVVRR